MNRQSKLEGIFSDNRKVIVGAFFIVIVGICSGIILERGLLSDDKTSAFMSIEKIFFNEDDNNLDFFTVFISYVKNSVYGCLIYFILTLLIVTFPLIIIFLFSNGFSVGFTSTIMIDYFGKKAEGIVVATILPYSIINVALYTICVIISLGYLSKLWQAFKINGFKGPHIKNMCIANIKDYSVKMLLLFIVFIVADLIQALLVLIAS